MRKASKILLYVAGALLILAILSTITSIVLAWLTNFVNVGINVVCALMLLFGVKPDVVNTVLNYTSITSLYKFFLYYLGQYAGEEVSKEALMTTLITDSILQTISLAISTIALILPIAIAVVGAIFAFQAAGKNSSKKKNIRAIVGGGLVYVIANQMIGLVLLAGGVLGTIADTKEENAEKAAEEEKKEPVEVEIPEVEDIE